MPDSLMPLQTLNRPIETSEELQLFIAKQKQEASWARAELFVSNRFVLLGLIGEDDDLIQVLRLCFPKTADTVDALKLLAIKPNALSIRKLKPEHSDINIGSITEIEAARDSAEAFKVTPAVAGKYFEPERESTLKSGRGKAISSDVARQLMREAHGRCMFTGCGEDLTVDGVAGYSANYTYLAHIISSAPDGPRGCEQRSHELSSDPNNVMILCDKHHRLIDKVAVGEYGEFRLQQMREQHISTCNDLLDRLGYPEARVLSALWPIGSHPVSGPDAQQAIVSLQPLRYRPSSNRFDLLTANTAQVPDDHWWTYIAPRDIHTAKTRFDSHYDPAVKSRAALYTAGPMPMMTALGAALGNKTDIHTVPLSRTNGWGWHEPSEADPAFIIDTPADLDTPEVIVTLFLTATPKESAPVIEYLGWPVINITSNRSGYHPIGRPSDGEKLRNQVVELLHELRSKSVRRVHLLLCTPNATCVEFGRGIEHLHNVEVRLYEHVASPKGKYMVPRLEICPGESTVDIRAVDPELVSEFHQYFTANTNGQEAS